jgi:hypothetical protein
MSSPERAHDPLELAQRRAELAEQGERAQARRAAAAERRVRELEGVLLTNAAEAADAEARRRTTERDLRAALAAERQRAAAALADTLAARALVEAAESAAAAERDAAEAVREAAQAAIDAAEEAAEDVRRTAAEQVHTAELMPAERRLAGLERDLAGARGELAQERELRLAVTAELSRRLAFERAEFARRRAGAAA